MPLSRFVSVRGRFHRSVNLSTDSQTAGSLSHYVLTESIRELASRIIGDASRPEGNRCWSITGPYGSGKSAFAVFLADALTKVKPEHPEAQKLRKTFRFGRRILHPVLLTASRAPLSSSLDLALNPGRRKQPTTSPTGEEIARSLALLAAKRKAKGDAGLLLVIDELGKFLEFAARNPSDEDVFLLQQLAETASRSEIPIVLATILHSGFSDYLGESDSIRRAEWHKVQGRFADIPYQLPAAQMLQLMSEAIEVKAPNSLVAQWRASAACDLEAAIGSTGALPAGVPEALHSLPLHPVTSLLLWPLFRSKGAQNERSLFAFLAGHEPFGLQHFLLHTSGDASDLYRPSRLYDYVISSLSLGAFRGDQARRWSLIDQLLHRIGSDAPSMCADVLKTIGLLEMFGGQVGIRANVSWLTSAIGDAASAKEACQYLEAHSSIVYRRHLDAYGLWEGSDFEIDVAHASARTRVAAGRSLAERLRGIFPPKPLVARRHYIRTGTLRHFTVQYADLTEAGIESAAQLVGDADGTIVFLFAEPGQLNLDVSGLLRETTLRATKPLIFVLPAEQDGLLEAAIDHDAWHWVAQTSPELGSDAVARQEVRSRIAAARGRLMQAVGSAIGLAGYPMSPAKSSWWYKGSSFRLTSPLQFQEWLSSTCDEYYPSAPVFRNELLNRSVLSSAASAARRNLIARMLEFGHMERLGLSGYPPEAAMYESLLQQGRIHIAKAGRRTFVRPVGPWAVVWNAIDGALAASSGRRIPLPQIFDTLKRPPIGLRDGLIPVLLCAYLKASDEGVGLYEDKVLVPQLRIEVFERLMRNPGAFELRSHTLLPEHRAALRALGRFVSTQDVAEGIGLEGGLLGVVRSLVTFAGKLPPFTRQTRRFLPPDAASVRDHLLTASDPITLLFVDLPAVLGVDRLQGDNVRAFVERLSQALNTMSTAYEKLLDEVESGIQTALGLSESEHGRSQLAHRAAVLVPFIAEPRLQLFAREAAKDGSQVDWRERMARAVNGGLPATHWKDSDAAAFQMKLRELSSDFLRVEELSAEQRRAGSSAVLRIGLLDGTGAELRRIVHLRDEEDGEVSELFEQLMGVLKASSDGSGDQKVTQFEALGRAAIEVMRELSLEGSANGR